MTEPVDDGAAIGSPLRGASPPSALGRLTSRQRAVLALLGRGCRNSEILDELGIRQRTLKADLRAIYRCLAVANRTQAAIWEAHRTAPDLHPPPPDR